MYLHRVQQLHCVKSKPILYVLLQHYVGQMHVPQVGGNNICNGLDRCKLIQQIVHYFWVRSQELLNQFSTLRPDAMIREDLSEAYIRLVSAFANVTLAEWCGTHIAVPLWILLISHTS